MKMIGVSLERVLILLVAMSLVAAACFAEESAPGIDAVRRAHLEQMKVIIDQSVFETVGEQPTQLKRTEHPVLRYTNPQSSSFGHGALFLALNGKRPAAAISMSYRDNGTLWWELTSLSNEPLKLTASKGTKWLPNSVGRKSEAVPNAAEPATSPALRLTQMRTIARLFSLQEYRRDQWQEGRLLTQPLYRWDDDKAGVMDGALFAYVETTDPEVVLLLEARREPSSSAAQWFFSLARTTSSPVKMSFNEREIWSVEGYWRGPRSVEDPYVEQSLGPIQQN